VSGCRGCLRKDGSVFAMTSDDREAAPAPREVPKTGEPSVDEAVQKLDELNALPVADHVGVFDESHRRLQDALADLDEE
jgi:hypothetical protein